MGFARAGVVVPNGTLFGDGVTARIRQDLITDFNLHTVIRLPEGVFSPYTDIPTNVLFFERTGTGTEATWYYEISPPEGRKRFTKTNPLTLRDLEACLAWWGNRVEDEHAWRVSRDAIADGNYALDLRNPRTQEAQRRDPKEILADVEATYADLGDTARTLAALVREVA